MREPLPLNPPDETFAPRLEQWPKADLKPHGLNWRTHPEAQRRVIAHSIKRLGIVKPFVVNRRTGRMIDGHARYDQLPDGVTVPVWVVDLLPPKEAAALLFLDRVAKWAKTDGDRFRVVCERIPTDWLREAAEIGTLFDRMQRDLAQELNAERTGAAQQLWAYIECPDEQTQHDLYDKLRAQGRDVRVHTPLNS